MSDASTYLAAFLCGGILCLIGQILIDKTKLTPARILTACRRFLAGGFMDNSLCNVFTGFPVSLRI